MLWWPDASRILFLATLRVSEGVHHFTVFDVINLWFFVLRSRRMVEKPIDIRQQILWDVQLNWYLRRFHRQVRVL